MFISKKFKGEMKLPRPVEVKEVEVKPAVAPKEKKSAPKKKVAEKPAEKTNEEKNEE